MQHKANEMSRGEIMEVATLVDRVTWTPKLDEIELMQAVDVLEKAWLEALNRVDLRVADNIRNCIDYIKTIIIKLQDGDEESAKVSARMVNEIPVSRLLRQALARK